MPQEKTLPPIRINSAKRAIAVPGLMSACLVTGTDKIRSGFGNGDCLLVDFENLFFAVADGSDRWSSASLDFLLRLTNALSQKPSPSKKDEWLDLVNTVYARQSYNHKTTFSGLAISDQPGQQRTIIIHGGDSLILFLNLRTGKFEYQSYADMNFAGRTRELSNAAIIPLRDDPYRLIIASDGLADLARLQGQTIEQMCAEVLFRFPVHEIPEQLDRYLLDRQGAMEYDDIGIIVLDPERVKPTKGPSILMGGTSPRDEGMFQEEKRNARIRDEWLDASMFEAASEELQIAGIRVVGKGAAEAAVSQVG